jgi:primase-polymerase (primpol)-like protein
MPPCCDQCGGPIDQLRSGRIARFCSDKCRVGFHRAAIPELMRKEHRWVTYSPPAMVPLQIDGSPASTSDLSTWTSYPRVRGLKYKAYMLGANVGCVIFGNVVDAATVEVHPMIGAILEPLVDKTYIELSPSGDGLHVFGILNEDTGWQRSLPDGMSVELASRDRVVTVTGRRVSKSSRLHPMRQHFADIEHYAHLPV